MAEFTTPVDIANRGCQVIGAPRISAFTDDAVAAAEAGFIYDKLRRSELERNNWVFAIRKAALRAIDPSVLMFVPAAWNVLNIYPAGAIVSDGGQVWQALQQVPAGQEPGDATLTYWDLYFGPMAVTQWQDPNAAPSAPSTTLPQALHGGYYAGELVYVTNGLTYDIYLSLINGNSDNPSVYPAWSSTTTYGLGDTVDYPPTENVTYNGINVTYNGIQVTYGGVAYQSTQVLNLNQTPGTNGAWARLPILNEPQQLIGSSWLKVGGLLEDIRIVYPIGAGPGNQTTTRNAFLLPNGFLKEAAQSPRSGDFSFLGAPSNVTSNDWVFEGNYITSSADAGVIILRFTADVRSVPNMHSMFCEGLGCRVGEEICETVTQSTAKEGVASKKYQFFMGEARTSNAIENSSDEPPLDDYIACRI